METWKAVWKELKKDIGVMLGFFEPVSKFSKKRVSDYKDDSSFDFIVQFLEHGLHNILWYIIQIGLVFLITFIVFRTISFWNLVYTIIIFLVLKFAFQKIMGK